LLRPTVPDYIVRIEQRGHGDMAQYSLLGLLSHTDRQRRAVCDGKGV
jgi:hypothetical protein